MTTVPFYPNARAALAFSGTRDVMRNSGVAATNPSSTPPPSPSFGRTARYDFPDFPYYKPLPAALKPAPLKFGAHSLYEGPFNRVRILTDYGAGKTEGVSNIDIADYFLETLEFAQREKARALQALTPGQPPTLHGYELEPWVLEPQQKGVLYLDNTSDIPGGNTDFATLALNRLGGDRRNKNIFVHVTDPGVGANGAQNHDRTILVTQDHGIYIGPNNGSLGLLVKRLQTLGEQPRLLQIDFDKLEGLEQIRFKDDKPGYKIPTIIHGRDVFAPIAAYIAAGVKPEALAVWENGKPKEVKPVFSRIDNEARLPKRGGGSVLVEALRDNTFANLRLNVFLKPDEFNALLASGAKLQIRRADQPGADWIDVPVGRKFSDVPEGELVAYHGSLPGIEPGSQNLEIAANLGYAGERLGIDQRRAYPLELRVV